MLRIRFHGRGGQGMKTASRILGSACFLSGCEVQDAPRYGAERRGAPVFAYVRVDDRPIWERGVIGHPDLAVVADPSLISVPAAGVLAGLDQHSLLLVNSTEAAELWRDRLGRGGGSETSDAAGFDVLVFDAGEGGDERADLPLVGAACAAAAARLLGFITPARLEQAVQSELGELGEAVVARNLAHASKAFEQLAAWAGRVGPRSADSAQAEPSPDWVDLPFEQASVSAPVIHAALTSEAVPTGLWRTLRPVIDYDRCNRCWWVCSAFCPDGAIRVEDAKPVIDYDHCKGCLVCVAQCPPHAIDMVPEAELRGVRS
jgi:pyruvate ferredoxin oxidoreductase gamma subunit